ncbi:hypothetical protein CFK37_01695 [Virgibacillus phasianinus]|uniref:DUF4440 domain-containing protein n=1 Tax=Virgibacillus phasianinus TaxID=2017483 RepID=A0A220TYF1_9BACI|nr:hypothetical protein [Virgibacillus phasianinus]ASK61014.1 hypothetical protein CFK37_01695 [Virgibacillus phasianinus]
MSIKNNSLRAFTTFHNRFLQEWKKTMETGDTAFVEKMSPEYYVTFFAENHKPAYFNRADAIEGLRDSVGKSVGRFTKNFENRVIRMKQVDYAIVFYEQILVEGEQEKARLFTIENWKNINDEWLLMREVEEQI